MTSVVSKRGARLAELLEDALVRHRVPGAVLGLSVGDETAVAAAGVASLRTQEPVRRESLFPLGSVTKLYQTTLLLSLGLDIDDPVQRHLPGFRVADPVATEAITIRHLMTHSSGLESDYIADFGRGDDAVRRYVESCATLGQLHPPGLLVSYCNSGAVIAGRIVEQVVGSCWDDSLRDRLLVPAGLEDTASLPEEAILRAVAVGHMPGPTVATKWSWPRAFGPAGGTLAASAPNVLAFARLHLQEEAPVGSTIARSMAERQKSFPDGVTHLASVERLEAVGLGWLLWDWDGTRVLGHDGGGLGCFSSLRVIPERDAAVVCLANYTYGGIPLARELVRAVLNEELGVRPAQTPRTENPHTARRYVGRYRRLGVDLEISERLGGRLAVRHRRQAVSTVFPESTDEAELEPVGPDRFRGRYATFPSLQSVDVTVRFVDTDDDGIADYAYEDTRAHRRIRPSE